MEKRINSEELYFEVYEVISENGDFFQPEDERWSLPEIIVTLITSTIFLSFFEAIFGKLGEDLLSLIKKRVFKGKKVEVIETEKVIQLLTKLQEKKIGENLNFKEIEKKINSKIKDLGLSEKQSKELTQSIVGVIKSNIKNHEV